MISPHWKTPKNWVWCHIGTVCEIVSGGTPKTSLQENFHNGDIPWITPADLSGYNDVYISKGKRNITAQGMNSSGARLMPAGTVLFSSRAPIGYVAIAENPLTSNQGFKSFIPPSGIAPKYLYYFLIHVKPHALKLANGTTFQEISGKSAEKIPLTFPALNEQLHIVSKIEELLSVLDAAVAGLERIKTNLKRYRASVLQAAVEGRLTADWRTQNPPGETGAELLARILKERRAKWEESQFKKYAEQGKTPPRNWKEKYPEPVKPDTTGLPELPEGWVWASVDQLAFVVRGASPRPAGDERYFNGSIPWITVAPLTANNSPYLREVQHTLTDEGLRHSRYIEPYTLLLSNSGATLGVPKITTIGGCINDGVAAILGLDCDLKKYVLYFLRTKTKQLRSINQGAAQPNLNTNIIKAIVIPVPCKSEVKVIVGEIESRLDITESSEKTVDSALQRAAHLRQSILKRAFEGRLVPQDPNDEPASALLERIRAERLKQAATLKPARAKRKVKGRQADTSTGEIGTQGAETA